MSDVDLAALRRAPEDDSAKSPRPPVGPRLAVACLVVVALAVAGSFLWPILNPPRVVRTAPVRPAETEPGAPRASLVQAAGWVEPDPFPVEARPLVSGVLETLDVLEGDAVKAGETRIGRLRSAAIEAALDRARATLALREAELERATTRREVAESVLAQKADPRAAAARVERATHVAERERDARTAQLAAARARLAEREADLAAQEKLRAAGGSYPVALARARAAREAAAADVRAAEAELAAARAHLEGDRALLAVLREVVADPRVLAGAAERARVEEEAARAARDKAKVELAVCEREYEWTTVLAPVDGVVMKLLSHPGRKVGPDGEGLVAIYDPAKLQVRVDVPLASAPGVRVGQDVEVRSEVLGNESAKGVVTRVQRESDLLKNTLQVKVRLIDPDPILRPETLCRARFLADAAAEEGADDEGAAPMLFRVPREALRDGRVFVVTPDGAKSIAVESVGQADGDAVVRGELSVTQRVVLDPVEEGEKVREESR